MNRPIPRLPNPGQPEVIGPPAWFAPAIVVSVAVAFVLGVLSAVLR